MKNKFLLFLSVFLCTVSVYCADNELKNILTANKSILWTLKPEQCSVIFGVTVRQQDKFSNVMRYSSRESRKYVRFEKHIIPEIIFNFEKRQLQSISISIYNRGDNGVVSEKFFAQLGTSLESFITDISQDAEPETEVRRFDKFRVESKIRRDKVCDYVIRRNRRGKQPEYLQLFLYPVSKAKKLREALRTVVRKDQLQLNLNITPDGDNFLDIPMVNQGSKGYCVDATVERIMKYYGSRVDQQIIAQLAESDAYRGTNIRKIINVLDKNKSKLKINVEKLINDNIMSIDDLQKFTNVYNGAARKRKRNRLKFNSFCSGRGRYRRLNYYALIGSYEYDLFREARCRNRRDVEKFAAEIQESIVKGVPLAWVTFTFQNMRSGSRIGKFGFHMRIINGFNKEKNQIIYTDSWGKGHEKKYMPINDARAITLMLIKITPR